MAKRDVKKAATKGKRAGARASTPRHGVPAVRAGRTRRVPAPAAAPAVAASAAATAPAPGAPGRLPRDPKGRRAQFYADPAIDQLWAVVTSLTAEVSVAFDRLDTLERLLERDGSVSRASIEAYRPDDAAAGERARRREELIQRVFQVLSQYGRG